MGSEYKPLFDITCHKCKTTHQDYRILFNGAVIQCKLCKARLNATIDMCPYDQHKFSNGVCVECGLEE